MHHIVTHGFVDRPRRGDCTAGQMDEESGWWTTSEKIGLPHDQGSWEWVDNNNRKKGGIRTLIKSNIKAYMSSSLNDGPEQHTVTVKTRKRDSNFIIMGDFYSHSQSWVYDHIDARGDEIEIWQYNNNLTLINQSYSTPTFYSRCSHTFSTPDIALCTEDLHSITKREVGNQLGGSDHRPVYLTFEARTVRASTLPRWNYNKAN